MKTNRITGLIAARMGSSRFKGKTLADLGDTPMIEFMIKRVLLSKYVDDIVIATGKGQENDILERWCSNQNIKCFRGDDDDVLGRLYAASSEFNLETIVELLGDNPFVHSSIIDGCIKLFHESNCDYVATLTNEYPLAAKNLPRFPIGVRVQVFNHTVLETCHNLTSHPDHREHATSFIAENPDIFKSKFLTASGNFASHHKPEITFAVNRPENLKMLNGILQLLPAKRNFDVSDALMVLELNPSLLKLMGN